MGRGDGVKTTDEMRAARKASYWGWVFSASNAKSWSTITAATVTLGGVIAASKGLPPEAGAAAATGLGALIGIIGGVLAGHKPGE